MRYGEEIVENFDVDKDLEIWPNKFQKKLQDYDYSTRV